MNDFLRGLAFEIAQLRHAYSHLSAERVTQQKAFADGLIAPAIRFLEGVYAETADQRFASGTPTQRAETTGSVGEADGGPARDSGDAQKPQPKTRR